jgi:PAS domain S-box-containing protein
MLKLSESLGLQWEPRANILLVDDDPDHLRTIRCHLEDLAELVVEARTGEEAVSLVKRDDFAVILLAVMMPGISGFETAKFIRSESRSCHTPIIFLTDSNIDRVQMEEGYTLGAVDFLIKPIVPIAVQAKVRSFVNLFQDRRRATRDAEQFRLLVQGTTEYAIFMLDPHGRVISWNPGAERIKGYTANEIIGQRFTKFYPKEDIDRGWPTHELEVATQEGRFEDEGWRVRKDGSRFWANVVITALKDERGVLRGFSKITRDMTQRKASDESTRRLLQITTARRVAEEHALVLHEERERLRVTLASIGDAVISTDTEGRVVFLNPVAEGLVGWKSDEIVTKVLTDVIHLINEYTREPVENPVVRVLKEGMIVGLANHTILVSRDGTERPIEDSAAPIKDAAGRVVGCVLVFRDVTEQRRAAQEIIVSEARHRAILRSALDCVITMDHEGKVVEFNPAAETTFQYSRADVLGRDLDGLLIPESYRQRFRKGLAHLLATGEGPILGQRQELSAIKADGSEFPVELAVTRISPDGPPLFTAYMRDISQRKQAEAALAASEQNFRQLADAMPQIVWSADATGTIDFLNRQWKSFTGLTESAGNGGWKQILHPDDVPQANERWAASLDTGAPFNMEVRLFDRSIQSYRWHLIRTVAVLDESGQVARWFGTATDIQEQKRAEESARYLAEASASLALVVDYESTLQNIVNLAVPHFADWSTVDVPDADGNLRRLAVAHQDPGKIDLIHQLMHEYPPDPKARQGAAAVLRSGRPERIAEITDEMLVQGARDQRHLDVIRSLGLKSYLCVPLVVSGKPLGVLTFATAESGRRYGEADLTLAMDLAHRAAIAIENTRLYQALRETDRRKDEFLATLAHELRNPLAPIRNSLQILKMPRVDADTVERSREMMERQVQHLVRLVDDLLDVSRVMRGKIELRKERIELGAIVARAVETVQPLMDAQGHQLSVWIPNQSLSMDVDPVRLAQVIGNLLTNAAKYTEANGRIWLTAERDFDIVVLRVRDNGIGISAAMLPRIFELFVQVDHTSTKTQGGLGIGLTLVKNLVELHNGTISAHSEGLGKGSEFIVRLPVTLATTENGESVVPEHSYHEPAPSGLRLLLVDDNQDAAVSLAMLLRLQGHEVHVAHSGLAALEMARSLQPHIIFLDIGMPGMDGYEVARRIRNLPGLENVVLAALTGWAQQEDRRRTREAGFDHHLVKPPELKALEAVINPLRPSH